MQEGEIWSKYRNYKMQKEDLSSFIALREESRCFKTLGATQRKRNLKLNPFFKYPTPHQQNLITPSSKSHLFFSSSFCLIKSYCNNGIKTKCVTVCNSHASILNIG